MHLLDFITVSHSNKIMLLKFVQYLDKISKQKHRLIRQIHFYPIIEFLLELSQQSGVPGLPEHPLSVWTLFL